MAKDDKKDLYNTSMDKVNQSETEYNNAFNKVDARGDATWDRATNDYATSNAGYRDYAAGGGLSDADKDRMRNALNQIGGGGGGGAGMISGPNLGSSAYQNLHSAYANAYRPDYGEADTTFRNLTGKGGGFDEGKLAQIYGNVDTLTGIGQTGGITDEDKSNIMRKQMLEQEQTGGYTDQDKALIRAKSAASSPAYFNALKDNLQRQRGVSGNLANAGAVDFKLAREGAQQQNQDRIGSEIGLAESIRGGRESAGKFLGQQGLELAGLRTANQLQGARSAGDLGLSTQQGITANQARGAQGLAESQTGLGNWGLGQAGGLDQFGLQQAGGLDQWGMNKAQLEMQAAAHNASAGASNSRAQALANAEYEQWLTEYGNQQRQYGITGLDSQYNTNLDASLKYSDLTSRNMDSKYDTQGMLLGLGTQNRGATAMENAMGISNMVGSVAGAATGMGGLQGLMPGGGTQIGGATNVTNQMGMYAPRPTNSRLRT